MDVPRITASPSRYQSLRAGGQRHNRAEPPRATFLYFLGRTGLRGGRRCQENGNAVAFTLTN